MRALLFMLASMPALATAQQAPEPGPDWEEPWGGEGEGEAEPTRPTPAQLERVNAPQLQLRLGVGDGGIAFESDGPTLNDDTDFDVAPRVGLAYVNPVKGWLALGLHANFLAWSTEFDRRVGHGDSYAFALAPAAELRAVTATATVFFLRMAMGIMANSLATDVEFDDFREDASLGIGFFGDFTGGIQFQASHGVGIQLELGRDVLAFNHSVTIRPRDGSAPSKHTVHYLGGHTHVSVSVVFVL